MKGQIKWGNSRRIQAGSKSLYPITITLGLHGPRLLFHPGNPRLGLKAPDHRACRSAWWWEPRPRAREEKPVSWRSRPTQLPAFLEVTPPQGNRAPSISSDQLTRGSLGLAWLQDLAVESRADCQAEPQGWRVWTDDQGKVVTLSWLSYHLFPAAWLSCPPASPTSIKYMCLPGLVPAACYPGTAGEFRKRERGQVSLANKCSQTSVCDDLAWAPTSEQGPSRRCNSC